MKNIVFESFDKTALACCLWDDVKSLKGVIQLIHGMASHACRNNYFAEILNNNGYIVFADDHRGHGDTAGKDRLGRTEIDNFINSVKDEIAITKMLKEKYNVPVQLFAHSYGSFLAQRYIEISSGLINGIILSGSALMDGNKIKLGKLITSIERKLFGIDKPCKFLYNMSIKPYDKYFAEDRTKNAYLNRDLKCVESYNNDPLCGYIMSIGFYYSLMHSLQEIYIPSNLCGIRKDLPLSIMSGKLDPVGGFGIKVQRLYDKYNSMGLNNISLKLYDNVRHELISDLDKDIIIGDIIKFFNANI